MSNQFESRIQTTNNVVSCLGGERTALESRAIETPKQGEILLKLRVVGFCGTDLFKLTTDNIKIGMVLGHEIVGEIIALGSGVSQFTLGDRIVVPHHVPCGDCWFCITGSETMCESFHENLLDPGGFADHIIVKHRATTQAARKIPDGISDAIAVFMEPAACVLRGINRSGIQSEGNAAIMGGGSMGLLHLLVIKAVQPQTRILLVDPLADRRALAKELGADITSKPGKNAFTAAMKMTNGHGLDAVFDTVGGAKLLEAGIRLNRKGGSLVLFAHAVKNVTASLDLNSIFKFEQRIVGTYSGALAEQSAVFNLMTSKILDPTPLISHTMPLDEFATGYKLAKSRQALKILFTPSQATAKI